MGEQFVVELFELRRSRRCRPCRARARRTHTLVTEILALTLNVSFVYKF
jgi:hypothetical protein